MTYEIEKFDDYEVEDIDTNDAPDFCDAFVGSAMYDGRVLNDDELDELNEDRELVYELTIKQIY